MNDDLLALAGAEEDPETPMPASGARVALYSRFGAMPQKATSLNDQITVGRAYAGSHGWVEVCAEIDAGRSGMSTIGRLGLEHVLELAHQRAIDVVLVDQLHRLSRDARELSMLIDELHRCNVVVCTVAEGVIKEDGVSLLMQPMIEAHFYKSLRRTRQFSRKTGQKNRSARTCRHCGQEMYSQ